MASCGELQELLEDMRQVKRQAESCISRLERLIGRDGMPPPPQSPSPPSTGTTSTPPSTSTSTSQRRMSASERDLEPVPISTGDVKKDSAALASRARRQSLKMAQAARETDTHAVVESTLDQTPMVRESGLKCSVWDIHTNQMEVVESILRFNRQTQMFELSQPSSFMNVFRSKTKLPVSSFHVANCKRCYAGAIGAEGEEDLVCFTMELIVRTDDITTEEIHLAFMCDSGEMTDRDNTLMALRWLKEHEEQKQDEAGGDVLGVMASPLGGAAATGGANQQPRSPSDGRADPYFSSMDELFADPSSSNTMGAAGSPTPMKEQMGHQADFSGMTRIAEMLDSGMVNPLAEVRMKPQEVIRRGSLSAASRALLEGSHTVEGEGVIDDSAEQQQQQQQQQQPLPPADASPMIMSSFSTEQVSAESVDMFKSKSTFVGDGGAVGMQANPLAGALGGGNGAGAAARRNKMAGVGAKRRASHEAMTAALYADSPAVASPAAKIVDQSSAALSAAEELLKPPATTGTPRSE